MAKNPNPKLPNGHTFYVGKSGSGKSQALKQNCTLPVRGVRHLLWDVTHDHEKGTRYFSDRNQFVKAVVAGIKSGRGFRIGWDGNSSPSDFEWFAGVVWAALDGSHLTYVTIEELARVVETVGRAAPNLRRLYNEGRKFGAVIHAVTQRPQEIPKTVFDMSDKLVVGQQKSANIKKFAELLDVSETEIKGLKPLQFWFIDESSGNAAELKQLKYKN